MLSSCVGGTDANAKLVANFTASQRGQMQWDGLPGALTPGGLPPGGAAPPVDPASEVRGGLLTPGQDEEALPSADALCIAQVIQKGMNLNDSDPKANLGKARATQARPGLGPAGFSNFVLDFVDLTTTSL